MLPASLHAICVQAWEKAQQTCLHLWPERRGVHSALLQTLWTRLLKIERHRREECTGYAFCMHGGSISDASLVKRNNKQSNKSKEKS